MFILAIEENMKNKWLYIYIFIYVFILERGQQEAFLRGWGAKLGGEDGPRK